MTTTDPTYPWCTCGTGSDSPCPLHHPAPPTRAAVAIWRRVPYGREGTFRHMGRTVAGVLDVIEYGKGEYDGLVTLRVALSPTDVRIVQVLAEDVWVAPSSLAAMGAAARWDEWKNGDGPDA